MEAERRASARGQKPAASRSFAPLAGAWRVVRSPPVRALLSAAVFAAAAWLIWRQLSAMSWAGFVDALASTTPWAVGLSIALTLASYACLSATEWLAIRAVGHALSYRDAAMVAVPAYALTNSAGFSPATGMAFRIQLYGRKGISSSHAAAVALVAGAAVTLSGLIGAGLVLVVDPQSAASALHVGDWGAVALGVLLVAPSALWFLAFTRRAPLWIGGGRPSRLSPRLRALGLAAGLGDWLFSAAALFVLLPDPATAIFPGFLVAYVAGSLLSAAAGVPGGLGVFEAIVLALTAVMTQAHQTAAALLLYRCVYSLGPLGIWGAVTLGRRWVRPGRRPT
ncbi:MAG TPA: lysylphosphatidylglycerol synthase domain-containing protein [Phenylobacterium sp.]|nr:lysylphosphatidylglycerol synthase domain-containing protein [Phenylobacterium sp.]